MRSATERLRGKAMPIVATVMLSVMLGICVSAPTRADEPVRAVWQVQDIYFPYFGLTTYYSCDGLRDKVRGVLKKLDVRDDYIVSIAGCVDMTGAVHTPSVSMVVANAVPATDDTAKAFAADPKRAKLLARLESKDKTPETPHSDAPFDAVPRQVTLYAKEKSDVGASGDCELLEQMQRFVFPKLGVKVLKDRVSCTPGQGVAGNPSLDVELLVEAKAS